MIYHLYHATAVGSGPPSEATVGWLFRLMESGVEMFFVLSGFVICANVESAKKIGARFLGRFYLRRSLRLDPVYWVVIAINLVFLFTLSTTRNAESIGPFQLLTNMFYVNNIIGHVAIVPVGWTLCFEVQFYLAFAVLAGLTRSAAQRLSISIETARLFVFLPWLAASAWAAVNTVPMLASTWGLVGWHLFFLGASLRWAIRGEPSRNKWAPFVIASITSGGVWALNGVPNIGFALALAGSILWVWQRGALERPLFGRTMTFLGAISYSLYLLHPFVGNKALRFVAPRLAALPQFEREMAQWAMLVVGVALCIATSWVLHRVVELPAQRLSRRISIEG